MSPPGQSGLAPKHRACDECRTRKLACTKEPDGCARCKREGQVCHYSAQKPMGRPRKRPREDTNEATTTESAAKTPMLDIPPATEDPGLAFLSFLTQGEFSLDPSIPLVDLHGQDQQQDKADWTFGYTGNDFAQLNFDSKAEHVPSFSASNIDPALFATAASTPAEGAVPALSSAQSSSPASSGSPPTLGPTNCACIASLYLSLDSMQKLSTDMTEAVRQARLATKTAYQVVNCPSCSIPRSFEPATQEPHVDPQTIHNFQLLMLLATLIPSIAHAYERILHMVDYETAKAQAERREIAFKLENYGGTWGGIGKDCGGSAAALDRRTMEPAMWRLTVRALMRVDVYGISSCELNGSPSGPDPFHLGLKDIVTQMENRSKARHAIIDPMIMSGQWKDAQCALKIHKTGETPTCMKIIQIAKTSVDNLVIA